jgi:hypothetical protein
MVIDDYSFDNKFDIQLTTKPTGKAVVFYSGPNLSFRDAYKTFTPDNWNVSQPVYVRGITQLSALNSQTYSLSAKVFPASGTATTETYSVSRHIALASVENVLKNLRYVRLPLTRKLCRFLVKVPSLSILQWSNTGVTTVMTNVSWVRKLY